MGALHIFILYSYILTLFSQEITIAAHTLTPSQSIIDGQTLISQGGTFELGFFRPSDSNNRRYLGMWYKTIPTRTVVWVANRDSPLNDTSGVLKIGAAGNIVIVNKTESVIWSSNSSKAVDNPIVEFLESGNLVLRDEKNEDSESYLWQSFDYLGDTLLPGMKLGWDLKNGRNRFMSSWRSSDDPSHGHYTYGIELTGFPEAVIRNWSNKYYRSGPWNGIRFSGSYNLWPNPIFNYEFIQNAEEIYFMYQLANKSVISIVVLMENSIDGYLQRRTWDDQTNSWFLRTPIPRDRCDAYALCGAYGSCDMINVPICQCLRGFKRKSPQDWYEMDWAQGCEREIPVNCSTGEGFLRFTGVKLPDTTDSWLNMSMNLEECRVKCLNNCSCMAYTNSDINGDGSGCAIWFTDLIDIRRVNDAGQDLYIRMAASELGISRRNEHDMVIVSIAVGAVGAGMILLGLGGWLIWKKKGWKGDSQRDDLKIPLFDLATITISTNNFSEENKLGEGGFGPVYKGMLEGEQEIAVKRLSKNSIQGIDEFMNEVLLISKLQHRNLVRLLGCCTQGEEKMLVYEYMQNKSLDSYIFGDTKVKLLDWKIRFHIIFGIARGLLYLHHDSRLRIIHRDLKASNILLDSEMVPKISDFGMARLFGEDQIEAKTNRVVGTYGYMSPEYVVDGHFSVKSDVFSFGVLVLEIVSGKKNRGFCHPDHELNLLGHAWWLWSEDKSMELIDESIRSSCFVEDLLRCIHIGLLCVQNGTEQRPTMSSVVLMLNSETAVLPKPQTPGFYVGRSPIKSSSSYSDTKHCVSNDLSITLVEGR